MKDVKEFLHGMVENDDDLSSQTMKVKRYVSLHSNENTITVFEDTNACFIHPTNKTHVIVRSGYYSGRLASYEWGNATNNQLLPRSYASVTGYDDDGDPYAWVIAERLESPLSHRCRSTEPHTSKTTKNFYQYKILDMVKRTHELNNNSTFVKFLLCVKRGINSRAHEGGYSPITTRIIKHNMSWLRDLYKLLNAWNVDDISFHINSSEILARGNNLVLVNCVQKIHKSRLTGYSRSTYNISDKFQLKHSLYSAFPAMPEIEIIGDTTSPYSVSSSPYVSASTDIQRYIYQPR